jgi:hypothetical protein
MLTKLECRAAAAGVRRLFSDTFGHQREGAIARTEGWVRDYGDYRCARCDSA